MFGFSVVNTVLHINRCHATRLESKQIEGSSLENYVASDGVASMSFRVQWRRYNGKKLRERKEREREREIPDQAIDSTQKQKSIFAIIPESRETGRFGVEPRRMEFLLVGVPLLQD